MATDPLLAHWLDAPSNHRSKDIALLAVGREEIALHIERPRTPPQSRASVHQVPARGDGDERRVLDGKPHAQHFDEDVRLGTMTFWAEKDQDLIGGFALALTGDRHAPVSALDGGVETPQAAASACDSLYLRASRRPGKNTHVCQREHCHHYGSEPSSIEWVRFTCGRHE